MVYNLSEILNRMTELVRFKMYRPEFILPKEEITIFNNF